jgi:hypothetical protein
VLLFHMFVGGYEEELMKILQDLCRTCGPSPINKPTFSCSIKTIPLWASLVQFYALPKGVQVRIVSVRCGGIKCILADLVRL